MPEGLLGLHRCNRHIALLCLPITTQPLSPNLQASPLEAAKKANHSKNKQTKPNQPQLCTFQRDPNQSASTAEQSAGSQQQNLWAEPCRAWSCLQGWAHRTHIYPTQLGCFPDQKDNPKPTRVSTIRNCNHSKANPILRLTPTGSILLDLLLCYLPLHWDRCSSGRVWRPSPQH